MHGLFPISIFSTTVHSNLLRVKYNMFVITKKGVLSPLQSISLLAIFFTSMGVATVSPAMAKLAAQFPSNNYALISTLPTLFIVPTTLWAGAVAGKKIRYRTISLVGILLFLIGGIAPFFLTESFTVLFGLPCRFWHWSRSACLIGKCACYAVLYRKRTSRYAGLW